MNDLTFLQQLIGRWKASSPAFFKVITTLSAITTFIVGIPMLLTDLGITLPSFLVSIESKTVLAATVAAGLISKLTVATPVSTNQAISKEVNK